MNPEPWLRGPLENTNSFIAPVLYSFQQAVEDLTAFTGDLSDEEAWASPYELASVGFQLRHISGSVDRLLTYALGGSLSEAQLSALSQEKTSGASLPDLLSDLRTTLDRAAAAIRRIDPAHLAEPRKVGRKELPTTAIGLLVHIAEHTQRHVGQAIVTAKVVRGMRAAGL